MLSKTVLKRFLIFSSCLFCHQAKYSDSMNCNTPFSKIQIHVDMGVCGCKNITLVMALVLDL